jgi:hypothetical protein
VSVKTRATNIGIVQQRVAPGVPATFNLEVPGYTQDGGAIGGGGGGGGGSGDPALYEAYLGAAALEESVGRAKVIFVPNAYGLAPRVGEALMITDTGNGTQTTLEFVTAPGDPTTAPGAQVVAVPLLDISDPDDAANTLVAAINGLEDLFPGTSPSVMATHSSAATVSIMYTGDGGPAGGARGYSTAMDVGLSLIPAATPDPAGIPIYSMQLSHANLNETTIHGRLAVVDRGDGCIVVPLSYTNNGTWSAKYPLHPRGIEVTNISILAGGAYSASTSADYVSVDVRWGSSSGTPILYDFMELLAVSLPEPAYAAGSGYPLALRENPVPFPNSSETFNLPLSEPGFRISPTNGFGYEPLHVQVKSTSGTSAPANGSGKLLISYRVLN